MSSARNAALYKILEYVPLPDGSGTVCENRGSGIKAMIRSLRAAGMSLPQFTDEVASFRVVFPSATLLDDDTAQWLGSLGQTGLTDGQVLALARMRRGEVLKNSTYRQDTGVDSRVATAELRDLVDRKIAVVDGTRGALRPTRWPVRTIMNLTLRATASSRSTRRSRTSPRSPSRFRR